MSDLIAGYVYDYMRKRNDAIETMCERMLVLPGPYGVLVEDWDNAFTVALTLEHQPMTVTQIQHSGPKPDSVESADSP